MVALSALFPDSRYTINTSVVNPLGVVMVYNTNIATVYNGGFCCLWTVPSNATWAKFEVWGGGGGGGGACCCQQHAYSGGSGSYARKTIRVVPGQQYTICAGGSTCCSPTCLGQSGYPSYACNPGATYPLCLCASGGYNGFSGCFCGYGQNSFVSCVYGSACGYDFAICGVVHGFNGSTCGFHSWGYAPDPTYTGGGFRIGADSCINLNANNIAQAPFPGGGGMTSVSNGGGCCWGQVGAGGLVMITYK